MSKTTNPELKTEDLEELVPYTVPIDDTERKSEVLVLSLNGKRLKLKRGETVMIPRKYHLLISKKTQLQRMDREYKRALEDAIKELDK